MTRDFFLTVFDSILEYKKDDSAIEKEDFYFKTRSGTKHMRKTTCGWKFFSAVEGWIRDMGSIKRYEGVSPN